MSQYATSRLRRIACRAGLYVWVLVLTMLPATSASKAGETLESLRAYDLTAQPLDAALNAYIQSSGTQVFYETALTAGLTARRVKGRFTSEKALFELLSGTGLVARRTDVDTFVIVAMSRSQEATQATAIAAAALPFLIALQNGVVNALCRTERTRPGAYKAAVELWVAPTGAVQRTSLVGSTGDAGRDRALITALSGLPIGVAPPLDTPQPFILTIGARAPGMTGDCQG